MQDNYNHKEVEPRIIKLWEESKCFTPKIDWTKKPFSIFLVPPNGSGGMHIGNLLMVAIQDVLTRYHRAKGMPTLWVPSTDHGGYETQVTFERELEKRGKSRYDFSKSELFTEIEQFVERNNELIKSQIKAAGASVDWSRFRFTMDEASLKSVDNIFRKMVSDKLIYRRSYMVNYCALCGTVLADIELSERKENMPLYHVKFVVENDGGHITIATSRPEFLFAVTHVLINPADARFRQHIGKTLLNPITGERVEVLEEKRKFNPEKSKPFISPFSPSYDDYDYGYTLRNALPSRNLLDWEGNMAERYPGMNTREAREREVLFLKNKGLIEKVDESHQDSVYYCKRGHEVGKMITLTWFLKMDDEKHPLRRPALESLKKGGLVVLPRWREKGLLQWLEKMFDWPIARQNVWGIRIPIWYDISDPSLFLVWFVDKDGKRRFGNLKNFFDNGVTSEEVSEGLERIYASEGAQWVLERKEGRTYLPETDTFDTWFSSGQWGVNVFGSLDSEDFSYFYPSDSMVVGHDLLRLSVSRKILLSQYVTDRLPFKTVYLHRLILGADGQKMSKSLGNAVNPEYYLETYGADATRMALISNTASQEDFVMTEEQLGHYREFLEQLWDMGKVVSLANEYAPKFTESLALSFEDGRIVESIAKLASFVGSGLEKFSLAHAQERACQFLSEIEIYAQNMKSKPDIHISLSVLRHVFGQYLTVLHPFMPFITEELYSEIYDPSSPLAVSSWPTIRKNKQ